MLTLRLLHVAHPVRTFGASRRIRGLLDSVIIWLPSRHQQSIRINSFVGLRQSLDSVAVDDVILLWLRGKSVFRKYKASMKLTTSS
jgi:hypothetical protein